jgi:hypothetical protein
LRLPTPTAETIKDREQVLAIATHFARLDADDGLAALFKAPAGQPESVCNEEGWILGVT